MTKIGKRTIAALVATFMLTSFAGCSKEEQKPKEEEKPLATVEENKPTLKVLNIWQKLDYNTYPVAKVIEEKTGYKVEYEMLPQDKPEDKLNLLLASGQPYDLITILGGASNKALLSDYAKKGALLELTPLIDKYGPNIKSSVSQKTFDSMKVDGKTLSIANAALEFANSTFSVRKDWLEKLGIKTPTTVDEFVKMLKEFKDKDPGGIGNDKNIPLTVSGGNLFIENLIGAFGMPLSWNDIGGKLVPRLMDPAFKDYLVFLTDLYKQGLLDKEFPTNKDATINEKFSSGRAGVMPLAWSGAPTVLDALNKNISEAKIEYLSPLKGKDGKSGFSTSGGVDRISFIPKVAKNAEHAIKWVNAKLEKGTFKLIAIGEEGKHYTVKDDKYSPILPIFNDERNNANNYLTGIDEKLYPIYWQCRVRKDPKLTEAWEFLNIKQPAEVRKLDPMNYAPYLPEYAKNNASLNTMVNDYMIKVIVGAEQISSLDQFVQKWKIAGGDATYKEINDWYANFKK